MNDGPQHPAAPDSGTEQPLEDSTVAEDVEDPTDPEAIELPIEPGDPNGQPT